MDYQKLAELIGILLGDGSLSLRENNPKTNNRLSITFNSRDDFDYIGYVKELIKDVLDTEAILKFRKNENTADLLIFKKDIIKFFTDKIGLKLAPKWNRAVIPERFLSDGLDIFVLRGYFDTDGCLVKTNNNGTIYPRLEMKISPSPMQKQFIDILKKYRFNFGIYKIGKGKIRVQMNGKKELEKWIEKVGFSNLKHREKIKMFF